MKISQALYFAKKKLKGFVENPFFEAELLVRKILNLTREELYSKDLQVSRKKLLELIELRKKRYPIQYILGEVEFYSKKFWVREGVFIPRPETETLVEAGIKFIPRGTRVIEVGTGSGVIAITLALERPDLELFADDISWKAVSLARENARELGADVNFVVGDCLLPFRGKFGAVISNPPYVAPGEEVSPELAWEPQQAYLAPPDGLSFIKRLLREAEAVLSPHGIILLEISPTQARFLKEEYRAGIIRDLYGRERVAVVSYGSG